MVWKELSTSILPDSPLARCPESPFQGGIHITDGNCNRLMPVVRINFLGSPSGAGGTVVSVCALHGPKRLGSSPGTRAPWRWHATNNELWRVASQFSLCLFTNPQIILSFICMRRVLCPQNTQLFPYIGESR